MRTLLTLVLIIAAFALNAQTRRIAHRFHSGADHARYDNRDGNYGDPYIPAMVTVHLESGKDTLVEVWDSLANPKYLRYMDTTPRAMIHPRVGPKEDIRQMGVITHKLITRN
jgi:hypothetical protein